MKNGMVNVPSVNVRATRKRENGGSFSRAFRCANNTEDDILTVRLF